MAYPSRYRILSLAKTLSRSEISSLQNSFSPLYLPLMQFATSNLLTVRGYSREDVREMLETRRAWTGYLRDTDSRAVAIDALTKAQSKPWFDLLICPKRLISLMIRHSAGRWIGLDPSTETIG